MAKRMADASHMTREKIHATKSTNRIRILYIAGSGGSRHHLQAWLCFDSRLYPASIVLAGHHRLYLFDDRQSRPRPLTYLMWSTLVRTKLFDAYQWVPEVMSWTQSKTEFDFF